jgi:hypothetical protein
MLLMVQGVAVVVALAEIPLHQLIHGHIAALVVAVLV